MTRAHRVLIADPHPIARRAVRTACEAAGAFEVVAEENDLRGALTACRTHRPDLVVLDSTLIDAESTSVKDLRAIGSLRDARPDARIVILADRVDGAFVLACLRARVDGCVAKDSGQGAIRDAVETAASGGRAFPEGFEHLAVEALGHLARTAHTERRAAETLTPRELEVLRLLASGSTVRQVAARTGTSARTVESHATRLYRKLGARGRVQAVARAAALGLIELDRDTPTPP